ncbi:MAG: fumarylacetoacetate hydrolase family protein [Planctomycetes bacterium]|nr:fumarylacetoacetate hydrolase family protein [Planctomycetota bacterium]MCB9892679.1 fumarylacetoacetate hydrolase family protein [Planctomycetota bacterium]MCB9919757.1 fumarylacetoacetate hydrolase family protein [Planctomycetota bacterium]
MRIAHFRIESPASTHIGAFLPSNGAVEGTDGQLLIFSHPSTLGQLAPPDALDWFDEDGAALPVARRLWQRVGDDAAEKRRLVESGAIVNSSRVQLLAPVVRPGKFLCIGLNYRDHAEESGMAIPERPLLFSKFSSCVVGPDAAVKIPDGCRELDYEAEFAFVIGRRARNVAREHAFDHVLGYCCVNDVSARDFQFADGQWQRGKSCDDFAPTGPFVATRDEISDPHALGIRFRLNGETMQNSNTDQLIFGVDVLIAEISRHITLEPGDIISTGTPPGVGFARKPPVYLKDGDVMEVEIDGLGVLRNTVHA